VVHDQVDDDPDAALVGSLDQLGELRHRAVLRGDRAVVGDVVAAVAQRRRVERQEPEAVDAEPAEVVELVDHAAQVADAVVGRVRE